MTEHKPLICIVDDDRIHSQAMSTFLIAEGFTVHTFTSAVQFLEQKIAPGVYDLMISDVDMPGMSGLDLCKVLRQGPDPVRLPIILVTGSLGENGKTQGLESGADEFITKPFAGKPLAAKIRSLLEIRKRERERVQELVSSQGLNHELSRFLSPNVASRMNPGSKHSILKPHRAEVTVLFTDLRRFTAFSTSAEPEEVLEVLRQYYTAVGQAAMKYKGTLGHLAGDGIMVFFNDPEPVKDHSEVALKMALEARDSLLEQRKVWHERRYDIDFGMGLSEGYATIGGIGFDKFSQYSVIGPVTNFASRVCHQAADGQVLVSHRFLSRLKPGFCEAEATGIVELKGIEKKVSLFNVLLINAASAPKAA